MRNHRALRDVLRGLISVDIATSLANYWYFHIPNFILAALMYTMLARVLLSLMVDAELAELHLAFFLQDHRSGHRPVIDRDPKGYGAGGPLAVRFRLAVLDSRRLPLHIAGAQSRPPSRGSSVMSRNFYFIGIAFFGMINGIFNQLWLIFALLYVQPFVGPLLFGSLPLTLMFASLMVSTATVIVGGIPAAIYERVTGASDSTNASLWIWLAGTALLTLPAAGNFLKIGL